MNAKVIFEGDLLTILRCTGFNEKSISELLNKIADMPEDKFAYFPVEKDGKEIKCEIRRV